MPIIAVEITKTRDEKETQPCSSPKKTQQNKQTNKDRKEQGGTEAIVNEWGLNYFVVHLS